jgi:hypothetical protein
MTRDELPRGIRTELEQMERDPRVHEPIDIFAIGRRQRGVAFHAQLRGHEEVEEVTDTGDTPERAWRNFSATVAERLTG